MVYTITQSGSLSYGVINLGIAVKTVSVQVVGISETL